MVIQAYLAILTIGLAILTPSNGQLLTNEDRPSLLDRILNVVWEPSSLIRMWVGLDQLYNIALSWRTVAKKLASLPFGEGRSMDHVKIQEPRHIKYHKPSVATQRDRFNKIYASSSLSPIVYDARNRLVQEQLSNAVLQSAASQYNPVKPSPTGDIFGLPPPALFETQDVLVNHPESLDFLQNGNEIEGFSPFQNGLDPLAVLKLLELQKRENQKFLQDKHFSDEPVGGASLVPAMEDPNNSVLDVGPQVRLNRFLKLMKALGEVHDNYIRREGLDGTNNR